MSNVIIPLRADWSISWIYTKEEWGRFEKWNARRKGVVEFVWHFLFHKENEHVQSVELTEQSVTIADKRKYFSGPVTELRRVEIYDKKDFNVMIISYEIVSKKQLNEIRLPIPKGKLKEAIDAQEKLMAARK
jgi:hypothetical protein